MFITISAAVLVFALKDVCSGWTGSSQGPVLTLQPEDRGHEHLWIHGLREHLHGRVHQVGAEDGEELLANDLSLLSAGLGRLRGLPLGALPVDRRGMTPKWIGPVRLLLAVVDSAVLVIRRLTVRSRRADRVGTVAVVMRLAVGGDIRAVAADGPEAVMVAVVLVSRGAPPRGRAV